MCLSAASVPVCCECACLLRVCLSAASVPVCCECHFSIASYLEKTVVVKGKAPVDSECHTKIGKAHVHYEGNDVWDCMLNQVSYRGG